MSMRGGEQENGRQEKAQQEKVIAGENGGVALEPQLRQPMESRMNADLSQVRIHQGAASAEMNRQMNARAFTFGQDIYFGDKEYRPETDRGSRLLAHELAHTGQQNSGTKAVQMQGKDQGPVSTPAPITAQGMFGLPQGSRVVLNRTMGDFIFGLVQSNAPDVASALNAISAQQATLSTVNDDLVEIRLDQHVTVPANCNRPEVTYQHITIGLSRTAPG